MKRLLTIVFGVSLTFSSPGQEGIQWEKIPIDFQCNGASNYSVLPLENHQDGIAFAILAQPKPTKLIYALVDDHGNKIHQKTITVPRLNIEKWITTDAGLLIIGSQRKQGKDRPVAYSMDSSGEELRALPLFADLDEGKLTDVECYHEILFITGQLNESSCLIRLDRNLQMIEITQLSTMYEKSAGQAIAINTYGMVYVTGFGQKAQLRQPAIWKFDSQGNLRWDSIYQFPHDAVATDIAVLDNWDIALAGTLTKSPFNEDLFLARLTPNGKMVTMKHLPTPRYREFATTLWQVRSDELLVAGARIPYGARQSEAWVLPIDKELKIKDEELSFREETLYKVEDILSLGEEHYAMVVNAERGIRLFIHRGREDLCEHPLTQGEDLRFAPLSADEIKLDRNQYRFKGKILSKYPLNEGNVMVAANKIEVRDATQAMDLIDLQLLDTTTGQYCYELNYNLRLGMGLNEIITTIRKHDHILVDTFRVNNQPTRPSLHLLSIGIASDLEYTDEDAQDFVSIFQDQEDRLFERVYTTLVTSREETQAWNIRSLLRDFEKKSIAKSATIHPNDVMMIFISSHGLTLSESSAFYLQGSDHIRNPLERKVNHETLIHFENDVLAALEQIDCKKILFVDACKSGIIKGEDPNVPTGAALTQALEKILNESPGMIAKISSSSKDQNSFELKSLQNGIFTYALEQAFKKENILQVDLNGDRLITLGELFDYLLTTVTQLSIQHKRIVQTPSMFVSTPGPGANSAKARSFPVYLNSY